MMIDHLNLNNLRIFESVFRTGSMTVAAQELHITQSGVSQHIGDLEDVLGIRLFDRVKRRLIPTTTAAILFKKCTETLNEIEQTLLSLKNIEIQISGTVHIGMPMEFGNNVVLPKLALFCKLHPGVKFAFRYGLATEINEDILKGDLDFAFVDGFGMNPNITTQIVYDETLILCASLDLLNQIGSQTQDRKYFETLKYVDYQMGEPVLRMWFAHHLGTKKLNLNVRAIVMNVQGVAHIIQHGLAVGVLPGHLVEKLKKDGNHFHEFQGCGKPLKNSISVAYLNERTHSGASKEMLNWLMQNFN